ncbi:sterol o-acyltransferase-like protein [Xylona heveae TC161]|uniref:O-acyltransferase n=1 Tax=Xylona heveae (strain CBS 132557 / TC161) TaxID=1328760 RepID=A0A165GG78_XYLHT|nr:sterol o-acyltransferase-like protein [Xylona heveae TC161]KZF22143.1 sterol o-acyltransferase-like protein [Xylona heveae TC161]
MSTSFQPSSKEDSNGTLRSRPSKIPNMPPQVLRTMTDDGALKVDDASVSGTSSGRTTPLPPDAPPSMQSISQARRQLRAQQKHRIFPTIEYAARVSHFDPNSDYHDFRGFFVLFWIGLAIMVITTMLRNLKDTGWPMRAQVWGLFTPNLSSLAVSDLLMVSSTALSLPLHRLFRSSNGWLRWRSGGMAVQSIYQMAWLCFWVYLPFFLNWTWTAQVYFTLHTLTLFMKMHSYAFYNGHLSETQRRLWELDNPATASTDAVLRYPSSSDHLNEIEDEQERRERESKQQSLAELREDLAIELTSPLGRVTYPQNLTTYNFIDYLLCPTLCYELEYPRTAGIVWSELLWKTLAVFGCIFLLTVTSEEFILPVLAESAIRLEHVESYTEFGLVLAESISLLLFPFMVTFLLVFLVIFEYVLGAFAEITCFADRHFYSDWWNSTDWLEFSREWNVPVHHFFRRHVYGVSRPHLSRPVATLITFLISALAHELVMACITKKLRGYGFLAQMMQLPIILLQRTPWIRGRTVFNNICFWISMILGLSMMCALYVLI